MQMLHSLAGLKTQESRTKCSFVNTGISRLTTVASDWWDRNGPIMLNLHAGRYLFQQRYYLCQEPVMWECVLQWNLYKEVLGLTKKKTTNIFCQSLGPSLYRGSTVLNFIYFSKSGRVLVPPAPPPVRALQSLHLDLLEDRRKAHRLNIFYLAVNNSIALPIPNYFLPKQRLTRSFSNDSLVQANCNHYYYFYSFFPRTIRDWNSLPSVWNSYQYKFFII